MLDFLNEKDEQELHKEESSSAATSKDVSEKAAETAQDGFVSVENGGKNARRSTILLAVIFAVGLLGLFFMMKKGTPQMASAATSDKEQAQIDALVAKLGGVRSEMSNKMETIVKKFYEFANVKQILLAQLAKNPFRLTKSWSSVSQEGDKVLATTYKANDFQIFSIMRVGTDPAKWCCMINDKLLYQGETIAGFTVAEIGVNYVLLRSGENKITLKLAEE
jgi:preprotein translocase subunit SecG